MGISLQMLIDLQDNMDSINDNISQPINGANFLKDTTKKAILKKQIDSLNRLPLYKINSPLCNISLHRKLERVNW